MAQQRPKTMLFDGKSIAGLDQWPDDAWTPIGGANAKKETETPMLYEAVAWLYRCVHIRANAVSHVPWVIRRGQTDLWTNEEAKPPANLEFLARLPQLLFLAEGALCLTAESFWFVERNARRPLNLKWNAPSSVTPIWDEAKGLVGFNRQLSQGTTATFEPQDYVYIRLPNFTHETLPGIAPARAAMRAAGVLYHKDEYEAGYFQRGAIKATLLQVPPGTPKSERDAIETWWNRLATGIRKAFTTIVISSELSPVVIGEGIGDLGNSPLTREKKEDISTALGVPHSLVFSNAANFATATQDWLNFYDQTIVPECNIIARQANEQLLEPLGLAWEFRPEGLSVYQEDENNRSQSLAHLVTSGAPLDLAMEILGYDLTDEQWARVREPEPAPEPPTPPQPIPPQFMAEAVPPVDVAAAVRTAMRDREREDEVRRFKRWAGKRADPNPAQFESDILSDADKRELLGDSEPIKAAAILHAHSHAPIKALQVGDDEIDPALSQYENDLGDEVERAIVGDVDKPEFENRTRDIVLAAILLAFLAGVGKTEESELTTSERAQLRARRNAASEAVGNLADDIYNRDRFTPTDRNRVETEAQGVERARGRVLLWVSALAGTYAAAQLFRRDAAGQSPRFAWVLGATVEHCSDCLRLSNQVHSAEDWAASGYHPQGRNLECGGWRCDCRFDETEEPERGAF